MKLAVDLLHHEVVNETGVQVDISWKILSFGSRSEDDAYLDWNTGRKHSMKKVIKNRRLRQKLNRLELLQLPAGSEYMLVQEFHDGKEVFKRCYNLDMLQSVRNIRVIDH